MQDVVSPFVLGLLSFPALVALVVLGVRVAFAAGFVGLVGLILLRGFHPGAGLAGFLAYAETTIYPLSVLPLFILIGFLAHYAKLTDAAFRAARCWFGWLPGGLAVATVFATAGFSAVSGSSTATAAVFARVAIPEMLRLGHSRRLAAGVVAASGTLASLIPPSGLLVLYGLLVEESIGKLLIAGFIPGLVTAVIYALIIVTQTYLDPAEAVTDQRYSWTQRFRSLADAWAIVAVIGIILAGLYTGWMTPTEVGAVAAFVVLALAVAQRRLSMSDLDQSLVETTKLTVMIFTIIWCVMIYIRFLAFTGVPRALAAWAVTLDVPGIVIILVILAMYVMLGMFLEGLGMLLLTLPVVYPVVQALGYDPIWFGIILVKMVEIGLVTPPIGLNCFIVNGVRPDIALTDIFRGILPFVVADILTVAVLLAFPGLVLWLPEQML